MATMVENTILYTPSGVNIIGSGSNEFIMEDAHAVAQQQIDDREEKMMIFRALVGQESEQERQEKAAILASLKDGVDEPAGLDDHVPPPFLETETELPSASTVFDDMGGNKNKHTDAQETFQRLTKEKEEFLDDLKADEPPAAFDTFKDNEETFETVYEKPVQKDASGMEGWSWFTPPLPASTRQSTRDKLAEFPETMLDQTSQKYKAIKVFQSKDTYDRTFFMLDDGIRQHLMLVLFEVNDQQMLSINDVMMPLEYFLNASQAIETEEEKTSRPIVRIRIGHELLEIPDTSVPMIMMALTVLNRYQKGQTVNTENKEEDEETKGNAAFSLMKWLTAAVVLGTAVAIKFASAPRA